MKFKNIFFDFLKVLLWVVIFYSGSLYADGYLFLNLQNYQPAANNFSPYFFERNSVTGDLVKVIDTDNSFQFKTYNLKLGADGIGSYRAEVRPVLLEWEKKVNPFEDDSDSSYLSGSLARNIEAELQEDLAVEVHIAIYKGRIEAISYVQNTTAEAPEIETIIANPWGMTEDQTSHVKGAGSSLLDNVLTDFKNRGAQKVQLYSVKDRYYLDRGWQRGSSDQGACE
ncbi:hypothetical protein [Bathymodiolus thermophilus thioautotrophic gill symbiont]|uniref:Uncharacterized protein n=1 Tax=Bathymodiolus thermophilus thioautotrophic gill symbiont TaxID=2360 RepID=A0A1J5TUG0_9GAMM|nr:hypothetical protein [Bathymodiolus thermophilus thioautotrophic gill symbiont]OIR24450.1 hypothetical protein BGC33_03630 [Bathymodiolus thermophilus thioautotrophic gill symbiont]